MNTLHLEQSHREDLSLTGSDLTRHMMPGDWRHSQLQPFRPKSAQVIIG